ncbi:ABC transporter permease [Chiayiivirga flava]|uniref:Sodium transport system permease protein n=1 Tax=Chiayiivirga flava TaxID=659595 RepID=A0A7W8D540_9GAMM|nr:ABC transporter permease [Chiayiivirga flava]MBB5207702.1 sodium transport system permease protein [Chiayiivirga flava]
MKTSALKVLWVVMLKELLDLMRDRRTVYISLFMGPLIAVGFIVGMGALIQKKTTTQLEKTLELPIVGAEHAPNLVAWLTAQNAVAKPAPDDPEAAIRNQDEDVILRIPEGFAEDWRAGRPALIEILHDSTRDDSRIPVARVTRLLEAYNGTVGALRLLARGVSPGVGQPMRVAQTDLSTPESRVGQALAFLPYLLIMSAFLGGAYLVIDATAGERERQSLEPLLATPASRSMIMSGKIAAACVFGLASLVLMLLAFKFAFAIMPKSGVKVDMSVLAMAKLLLILTPMLLFGTALLTLIAASAKSVKEAQSYMSLLFLLPMVPTIYLLISPVKDALWMMAVPFLSQNQMIMQVLRAETITALEWLVYLGVGFGAGMLLWLVASRLYHREKLAISA